MYEKKDFRPIAELDLEPIKVKLTHVESGEGWSRAYADAVEFEYRRFLYLMKRFPNEQAAPLFDVDVFWHYHILDTMKYADDCDAVFGYFLHHFPYVGLRGADDLELHHRVGERMRELYEQTFDCAYVRPQAAAPAGTSGQVAFSMNPSQVAFSMNASKIAFSMNTTQPAFSMNASKAAAFSMNAGALARPRYGDSAQAVAPSLARPQ
ncbi:MAG TPA: glycine-rich domain-containing protein-like [Telluria sp.]|nr:glycine-rich domain-containing protein-like [Telluria sp.]